jgi:hypothetical protein
MIPDAGVIVLKVSPDEAAAPGTPQGPAGGAGCVTGKWGPGALIGYDGRPAGGPACMEYIVAFAGGPAGM